MRVYVESTKARLQALHSAPHHSLNPLCAPYVGSDPGLCKDLNVDLDLGVHLDLDQKTMHFLYRFSFFTKILKTAKGFLHFSFKTCHLA